MNKLTSKAVNKSLQKVLGKASKEVIRNINPLEVLHEYLDYAKTVQLNETTRAEIIAKRDVAIQNLQNQKEIILAYFEKRFAERKEALQSFYTLLSNSLSTNNEKQLDTALAGIMGIIKDNPLGDFQTFKNNMLNADYEVEL